MHVSECASFVCFVTRQRGVQTFLETKACLVDRCDRCSCEALDSDHYELLTLILMVYFVKSL